MSHATARESVMLQVPNVGAFVRSLLPVHLTGGESVTFGVWLAIDPRDHALRRLTEIWWDDTRYRDLRLEGWLAHDLAPWAGLLAAPVATEVRNVDETPYCVRCVLSRDPQ
jgi:hypothetical protein